MTNVKKTLSVLLAFVLVLGTCLFSAFAANGDTATIKVVPDKTTAKVGDVITVSVKVDTNYTVASTSAIVQFDTADFELVADSLKMNKTLFGSELATDAVAYEPQAGTVGAYFVAKKTATYEAKTGVELFSFQLKALKDNAAADLVLPEAELKSTAKPDGKIYCGKGDAQDNIEEVPCVIALTNATVAIGGGAVATPELKGKLGTHPTNGLSNTGVVDETRGYVYGIVPGANVADFFEATNGGTIVVEKGICTTPNNNGTGAVLKLMNGTTVVKEYTVIILGDVDGDGEISLADKQKIAAYVGQFYDQISTDPTSPFVFAADADFDTDPSLADAQKVQAYVGQFYDQLPLPTALIPTKTA